MPQREAVLFANEAFYLAFRTRDLAAMEDRAPPGGPDKRIAAG